MAGFNTGCALTGIGPLVNHQKRIDDVFHISVGCGYVGTEQTTFSVFLLLSGQHHQHVLEDLLALTRQAPAKVFVETRHCLEIATCCVYQVPTRFQICLEVANELVHDGVSTISRKSASATLTFTAGGFDCVLEEFLDFLHVSEGCDRQIFIQSEVQIIPDGLPINFFASTKRGGDCDCWLVDLIAKTPQKHCCFDECGKECGGGSLLTVG